MHDRELDCDRADRNRIDHSGSARCRGNKPRDAEPIESYAISPPRWCPKTGPIVATWQTDGNDEVWICLWAAPLFAGVVTRRKLPALRLTVSWSEEVPQDQAQQRQQHNRDCPNQFLLVGNGALENIDNRPDITSEYQHAQEAVVSEIHHFGCSRFVPKPSMRD